jgi:hypothetical protein
MEKDRDLGVLPVWRTQRSQERFALSDPDSYPVRFNTLSGSVGLVTNLLEIAQGSVAGDWSLRSVPAHCQFGFGIIMTSRGQISAIEPARGAPRLTGGSVKTERELIKLETKNEANIGSESRRKPFLHNR